MPNRDLRIALVTGGSKGIGYAIVQMLTKEGIRVIVLDKADMPSVIHPELIDFRKCDLSVFDEVKITVREILRDYPALDYLVNNAGIQFVESLENLDFGHWDEVLTVNLKIPAFLIHSFSPRMKNGAHILNISSIHSRVSRLNKYAYDASKAGLASLTRECALALAEKGIRVNSISPGAVNTPMNDGFADPAMLRETLAKIPMKTIVQPEEIADLAKYLLFVSKNVTGSDFAIDGGRSLPL